MREGAGGLPYHALGCDDLVGVVAVSQLGYFKPDGGFHYSNIGYHLPGKIIERISRQTCGDFVNGNLFSPLGLERASLPNQGRHRRIAAPDANGYSYVGG